MALSGLLPARRLRAPDPGRVHRQPDPLRAHGRIGRSMAHLHARAAPDRARATHAYSLYIWQVRILWNEDLRVYVIYVWKTWVTWWRYVLNVEKLCINNAFGRYFFFVMQVYDWVHEMKACHAWIEFKCLIPYVSYFHLMHVRQKCPLIMCLLIIETYGSLHQLAKFCEWKKKIKTVIWKYWFYPCSYFCVL